MKQSIVDQLSSDTGEDCVTIERALTDNRVLEQSRAMAGLREDPGSKALRKIEELNRRVAALELELEAHKRLQHHVDIEVQK